MDFNNESNTDDTADLTKILYETLEDLYLETTLAQSKATIYEGLHSLRRKEYKRRGSMPSFETTQHIITTEDSVAL